MAGGPKIMFNKNTFSVSVSNSFSKVAVVAALISMFAFVPDVSLAAAAKKQAKPASSNVMDELDPFAPDIEEQLDILDKRYSEKTHKSPWLAAPYESLLSQPCYRTSCGVYAYVRRSTQTMVVMVDGAVAHEFLVSTGAPGHDTPDFDRHPNGRIYDQYSSSTYPGGNYQGLGNMPYAVFIEGGFAVHGTGKSNWKRLGKKASHGCVRLHPDNAFIFNRLVRQYGIKNVWIQIGE